MNTRTITNSGTPLTDGNGQPSKGTVVVFQLVNVEGQPEDMFTTGGERVSSFPISVTTDTNGEFSVDLATTDQAISPVYWKCAINEMVNGRKVYKDFAAALNAGVGDATFLDFRQGNT